MSLRKTLLAARRAKKTAFIPFVMAGDPDRARSLRTVLALQDAGADALELGVPFSDPVADGVTVARAHERALASGGSLVRTLSLLKELRAKGLTIPVCLFSYLNPALNMGYARFAKEARDAGADGALLVDLPPEEAGEYLKAARMHGLETVFLCSPTTTPTRLKAIDAASTGFVYYVAREGVTGARADLPAALRGRLAVLRKNLKNPVAVGFGISTAAHVKSLSGHADGVVVGSALVKIVAENLKNPADSVGRAARALKGRG